ncbi:MAG: type II secretion system F family protein [Armatimonadetes bacterium]|nr:type II secretion system F family protein [Armatimonadota bacterium]
MPLFRYEVADKSGKILRGVMNASSEAEVRHRLSTQGFQVRLIVQPPGQQAQPPQQVQRASLASFPRRRTTAPPSEMAVFFRGLASFLVAGVSVHEALIRIANQTPKKSVRFIAQRMASRVQSGEKLSQAMEGFPKAFPPHVIGVVAAGELGGFLPIVVGDIANDYEIANKAVNFYFKIGCWLGWLNAFGLILFALLPPMIFSPGVTNVFEGIAKWWHFTWMRMLPIMLVIILGYYGILFILRRPGLRRVRHSLLLMVPIAGHASKLRSIAGFTRILWRLLKAGILPITAWEAASAAAENEVIASDLRKQVSVLRSGMKLSEALAATGYLTDKHQRILIMGEQTGQIVDMLEKVVVHYEEAAVAAANAVKWAGLHVCILFNLIVFGIVSACVVSQTYSNMFDWVDWLFK